MAVHQMIQMCSHDRAGINYRIASIWACSRWLASTHTAGSPNAGSLVGVRAGCPKHGRDLWQDNSHADLAAADRYTLEGNAITVGSQIEVVTDVNRRRKETDLLGEFLRTPLTRRNSSPSCALSTSGSTGTPLRAQGYLRNHIVQLASCISG